MFLDFDGVCHPVSGCPPFHPACMEVLSSTQDDYPNIQVVISFSWREEKSIPELKGYMGPLIGVRIIGVTPVIDEPFMHHVRYHEVQAYLQETTQASVPCLALDDESGSYLMMLRFYSRRASWVDPGRRCRAKRIDRGKQNGIHLMKYNLGVTGGYYSSTIY